jgi:hypothetical protein
MMLGTSGKQWEQLTVKDDGTMTMTFHGTDREICHEVTENADGWLCYPGAMYPGLKSGKWQLTEEEPIVTVAANCVPHSDLQVREPQPTEQVREPQTVVEAQPVVEAQTAQQQLEPVVVETKPKHQRKERKPRIVAENGHGLHGRGETSIRRDIETQEPTESKEWLRSAGYLAAVTVALFVIYETGLLIPLGLIGLATGGILK